MNIRKLNEELCKRLDQLEETLDDDSRFEGIGGSCELHSPSWNLDGDKVSLGISSRARGSVEYIKDLEYSEQNRIANYKEYKEIESKLTKLANEFDAKVIALMKEYNYTLK